MNEVFHFFFLFVTYLMKFPCFFSFFFLLFLKILHALRERFAKDKVYTYVGPILCSVNPFIVISQSFPPFSLSLSFWMSEYYRVILKSFCFKKILVYGFWVEFAHL